MKYIKFAVQASLSANVKTFTLLLVLAFSFCKSSLAFGTTAESAATKGSLHEIGKSGTDGVDNAAKSTLAVSPSVTSNSSRAVEDRVYKPTFLPSEISFSEPQIDDIRSAAAEQLKTFHVSKDNQNRSAAAMYHEQAKYWEARSTYDAWVFSHNMRTFESHSLYTGIIFVVVILIVVSGLALTWYQFLRDSSDVSRMIGNLISRNDATDEPLDSEHTKEILNILRAEGTMELGKEGIKLRTRVLGLLTLALSMGFFYVYIRYVYPITIKEAPSAAEIATKDSSKR